MALARAPTLAILRLMVKLAAAGPAGYRQARQAEVKVEQRPDFLRLNLNLSLNLLNDVG